MKKNLLLILLCCLCTWQVHAQRFTVTFSKEQLNSPAAEGKPYFDGRLLLMLSTKATPEPRFSVTDGHQTQLIFGVDVENWKPGQPIIFDSNVFGYPIESLAKVPKGEYYVQALLHVYATCQLATGHTIKVPMDRGAGQQWNQEPGNIYSTPQKINFDPKTANFSIKLDKIIPPIEEPKDTEFVKHIKIRSERLSKFWGRDMYLGAHVLVPDGFEQHPEARYPLCIFHGHFPADFGGFRTTPPDPDLKPDYSERFKISGYNKIVQEEAYNFYKKWTSPNFPRFLIVEIQHANPYYDDSYAVNSANIGPYGDAIMYELIPEIEKRFRGIGQGWARFMYGGSTGGWEALAAQIFYPDEFNGCFAACPDPIDFRAYTLINLYEDKNAYYYDAPFKKLARPGHRDYLGQISTTIEQMNQRELVLGTKSRSGQQWDIWEAVYSPQGPDGYPQRIFDKKTGEINPKVAEYWRENYDLRYILQRDWAKLGPKLEGKIHIYCGDMDNFYLNNAVYLMEEFLEKTKTPYYNGEVKYGDRAEHCWNGDPNLPNYITRLRYNTMYVQKMMDRMMKTAPAGADLRSWRY
ncbi:hypothetical protein [Rhodoflexus caldus]|uniref:hypothetical protein n=1 Tax=Rhodoflexus caldus TaxID=2891236 RepID=UPI00202A8ABB|nr:hypothetical protein [Rhodoflexus caldus]